MDHVRLNEQRRTRLLHQRSLIINKHNNVDTNIFIGVTVTCWKIFLQILESKSIELCLPVIIEPCMLNARGKFCLNGGISNIKGATRIRRETEEKGQEKDYVGVRSLQLIAVRPNGSSIRVNTVAITSRPRREPPLFIGERREKRRFSCCFVQPFSSLGSFTLDSATLCLFPPLSPIPVSRDSRDRKHFHLLPTGPVVSAKQSYMFWKGKRTIRAERNNFVFDLSLKLKIDLQLNCQTTT